MCEKIASEAKIDQPNNITVKFIINEFETVAQVYASTTSVGHVLKDISSKFKLPSKYVTLRRDDHLASKIPYGTKLHQLCKNAFGIVNVTLRLSELANEINESVSQENERIKLDCDVYYRHYRLPDFISVSIPSDMNDEPTKQVIVEIINIPIVKPFVGGYVNRKTSLEYHNAFTQTGPLLQNMKLANVVTRDTQTATVQPVGSTINDFHGRQTQTAATSDCQRSSRILAAQKYVSYEEMKTSETDKIILIQRNLRRCLWQRLIKKSAHEWRQMKLEEDKRRMAREQTVLGKFMYKCSTLISPRTKSDFEMLLANVQKWKETETIRIHKLYQCDDTSKSVAYKQLLEHEIKLINEIRAKRQKILNDQQNKKVIKILDRLGAPVKWVGYKNIECEMDLLRTQKTRQLTALYRQLKTPMEKHNRIEFITRLSDVLKRETASMVLDALTELLDRERVFLVSDFDDGTLDTLRKRENELLANYIGGEKLFDGSKGSRNELNTKVCSKCKAIRLLIDFDLNSRDGESNSCRICRDLLVPSVDITIYRTILRTVRRDERKRNAISSCAFIIQDEDARVIMDQIWHGHSVLSQNNDLKILRLPRWNRALDWSPWNCVCLTETESFAHYKIEKSLEEMYSAELINMVQCNHQLARKMFRRLMNIDNEFVESGEWNEVGLPYTENNSF